MIAAVLILLIYFIPTSNSSRLNFRNCENKFLKRRVDLDTTYPLTKPVKRNRQTMYRIAIVSDLDTDSKSGSKSSTWISYLKYGNLTISDDYKKIVITFDGDIPLKSRLSEGGRGMELSELIVFNGKLYTVDDRTGVVYEIYNNKVIPWVILTDGNGQETKGIDAILKYEKKLLSTRFPIRYLQPKIKIKIIAIPFFFLSSRMFWLKGVLI